MVNSKMDKKIDSLEGALNAIQKQMEERDQLFTKFQSSLGAIMNRIEARLDAGDQNPGGGHHNRRHEGVSRMNDVRDEDSRGPRRARTIDQ